jgi:hypothetical protein
MKGYCGQMPNYHAQNTTAETQSIDLHNPFFNLGHDVMQIPFPSFQVTLPPRGEYEHHVSMPTNQFSPYSKGSLTIRIQYYDDNGILKQVAPAKVIFLLGAMTESTLKLNGSQNINQFFTPGSALNFEISSHHLANPLPGNSTIKLSLEKQINEGTTIPQNAKYTEIKTIQATMTSLQMVISPQWRLHSPAYHPGGCYRLKLKLQRLKPQRNSPL